MIKNSNSLEIVTTWENEDDTRRWYAKASRAGLVATGEGYSESQAIVRAKQNLEQKEKNLSPVSANWENTEIAMLATITASEVCPDYSPVMIELASM